MKRPGGYRKRAELIKKPAPKTTDFSQVGQKTTTLRAGHRICIVCAKLYDRAQKTSELWGKRSHVLWKHASRKKHWDADLVLLSRLNTYGGPFWRDAPRELDNIYWHNIDYLIRHTPIQRLEGLTTKINASKEIRRQEKNKIKDGSDVMWLPRCSPANKATVRPQRA